MNEQSIKKGDKVRRKRGRKVIGTVEEIVAPFYGYGRNQPERAYVRWHGAFRGFGGNRDTHSTVPVSTLERVEVQP